MNDNRFCVTVGDRIFTIKAGETLTDAAVTIENNDACGVKLYRITLTYSDISQPTPTRIDWCEPTTGLLAYWSPSCGRDSCIPQGWYPHEQNACMPDGLPLCTLYELGGKNYRTFALSEMDRQTRIVTMLRNDPQNDDLQMEVHVFEQVPPAENTFSFTLRIDETDRPMTDTIGDASLWLQSLCPHPAFPMGTGKRPPFDNDFVGDMPLFSSWYACFQNPLQSDLEKELPLARALGFKSMIIDDGWSYDGRGTGGYHLCGSWQVVKSKFPDMRAFVEKAHENGIGVAFWFPFPYVGSRDSHYEQFKDKLLGEEGGAGLLDPRFPDVRDFIIHSFVDVVKAYNLDGLKLDFLSSFNHPTVPARPGCDCTDLYDGIRALLRDLDTTLKTIVPHGMLEYRMNYISPYVVSHCNMLRAPDCANDFVTNRINTIALRLLRYPLAVHADMLLWKQYETPGNVAVMLQNVLFSVPQVSVLFQNVDPVQLPAVKNSLSYWTDHRDLLLYAPLHVEHPEANYTKVWVQDDDLTIAALYTDTSFRFTAQMKTADVFAANDSGALFLDTVLPVSVTTYDCTGAVQYEQTVSAGVTKLSVTPGASVHIERAK